MKCYFAHPVSDYGGSERQRNAIAALEAAGWTVENPDTPIHQAAYRQHGMTHFIEVVEGCDALAFMRFPDGAIGAGVAKEIERALQCRKSVFDVSPGTLLHGIGDMMPEPILTVEETRSRLKPII